MRYKWQRFRRPVIAAAAVWILLGYSTTAWPQSASVGRSTIVALEGGPYTPSLALALRITTTFDKKVEDVFWPDE